ncbi:cation diffusion facilitator family transporter [Clostridium neonatale]|uniref:Cobalt-zinc-cadmium resistance protein n=1 Tax=Clostridium neonatale TaxID=137838 RepID=A0AA86JMR1_9CLOT|nr:Cobalt-zinc-cadmium resistance protein [Clostridium neonatale]
MKTDNYSKIKRVLGILLIANVFVTIVKIIIGYMTNSVALCADGFHSFSDSASNIVGIVSITFASKPCDNEHPYGHKKIETMASLLICVVLILLGYNVIAKSIKSIWNPQTIVVDVQNIIIILLTVLINVFVAYYENKKGKEYNSSFLIADSIHTKSDIFISIGIIITLIAIKLGVSPKIDIIVSIMVALFIFHAAYEIFMEVASVLIDKNIIKCEDVKQVIYAFDEVKDVHKIISRGFKDHVFLDMHIVVDKNMDVNELHKLEHSIEEEFTKNLELQWILLFM